jgi:hypothetical protein
VSGLHPAFTPTAVDPEALDAITVGRADLIASIVERLRLVATTGTRAHTLLVGARGSGKTHVLAVSIHRALRDPEIARHLAVAWVPEDALAIGSYADLLVELIRQLGPTASERARDARRSAGNHDLERLLLEVAGDRRLVLVIENLDRVFAGLGQAGAAGLRGFVETDGHILLASSPVLFDGVQRREQPWFGSFNVEQLGDLTLAEGTEVVRRRAVARGDDALAAFVTTPVGQNRLRVIERLAGGSPRLWHLLAEAVDATTLDALVPAVQKLMDDLAPYYQQRLWDLAPGEQKLVVELARQDGMQPVAELAAAAGTSERAAATALGRLADARWVRKQKAASGDQRKTWYELREPLLRLHLQYRENHGEPLRAIVDALQHWFALVDGERIRWLRQFSLGGVGQLSLARAMDGDAEALLRVGPELRTVIAPEVVARSTR